MAKRGYWTAKRRAAFKKMRAGLARSRRVTVKRRRRHSYASPAAGRRPVRRRRFYRNPYAVIANPGALVPYDPVFAASQTRRKPKMARKRRRKSRRVARRRSPARRRRSARRPYRSRRRYYPRRRRAYGRRRRGGHRAVIYVNPRHRRRRYRRHRNPGLGRGLLGAVLTPFAAGFVTSAAMVGVDKMLANSPRMAQLAKVGTAFVIAFVGRRHPRAACAAIGAVGASVGYPLVTKLLGGMTAQTPAQAVTGLGSMSRSYPQMGALLSGGVGALLSGMGDSPSNLPTVASNYMQALRNNVSGDDD